MGCVENGGGTRTRDLLFGKLCKMVCLALGFHQSCSYDQRMDLDTLDRGPRSHAKRIATAMLGSSQAHL